jgi:hypothetical protein
MSGGVLWLMKPVPCGIFATTSPTPTTNSGQHVKTVVARKSNSGQPGLMRCWTGIRAPAIIACAEFDIRLEQLNGLLGEF